jgi:uncharacterized membrane protein
MSLDPTVPAPGPDSLNSALARNIAAIEERERQDRSRATLEERIAERITRFTGSMRFVYVHLALYGGWIAANVGWIPGIEPWDSTFVVLAMIASVEAIFLSTFVLISQNRMAKEAERRAALDLQINLLAEHEITRLMALVSAIAKRLEVESPAPDEEIDELKRDVAPEAVLDAIEEEK